MHGNEVNVLFWTQIVSSIIIRIKTTSATCICRLQWLTQIVSSIIIRIKTAAANLDAELICLSDSIFHYNKD